MRDIITKVKEEIYRIIDKIKEKYSEARLRLAFVGYRDHDDCNDRIVMKDFTEHIERFRSFVSHIKAKGGGDQAEDVLVVLKKLVNCHGRQ